LHFLYRYTHRADNVIFQDRNTFPQITLGGKPFANYTWDGDSDVPTFEFLGEYAYLAAQQDIYKKQILEDEQVCRRKPWTPEEDRPQPRLGWCVRGNKHVYERPITPHSTITETLAKVWHRADGRWSWLQKPSAFHGVWKFSGQGVARTLEEAKERAVPPGVFDAVA
jgi:hypothetical protein